MSGRLYLQAVFTQSAPVTVYHTGGKNRPFTRIKSLRQHPAQRCRLRVIVIPYGNYIDLWFHLGNVGIAHSIRISVMIGNNHIRLTEQSGYRRFYIKPFRCFFYAQNISCGEIIKLPYVIRIPQLQRFSFNCSLEEAVEGTSSLAVVPLPVQILPLPTILRTSNVG